jgi:TolB-like protein
MSAGGLQVHLLGPVRLLRGDVPVRLPQSRKVLGLLAYLALEGTEQSRTRLCDLLWDGPNDPRGELRWCLSKLRALVDDAGRPRVVASGNTFVRLDLSDVMFDARAVEHSAKAGIPAATTEQLVSALSLFRGELLEGLELDGTPELSAWLVAWRQRFKTLRVALARELAARPSAHADTAGQHLAARQRIEGWLALEPLEPSAHQALLDLLAQAGHRREGDEHLARVIRVFEREGLDWAPLRARWRDASGAVAARAVSVEAALAGPTRGAAATGQRGPGAAARASVAIMPFEPAGVIETPGSAAPGSQLALGLSDDIITRLAKLRALFVIARGTTHALAERGVDAREAGRILGVEYVVSGRVRRRGGRLSVSVELAETSEAHVIWADELGCDGDATFGALDSIVDRIVVAVAQEIEAAECQRAALRPPASLDAWEAYHRGLWHMYKFRPTDNREASRLFRLAIDLDPTFARAHAGLSFTHFQNVFLELTPDREAQTDLAFQAAEQSLAADERDPAAHWAVGRALWLRGAQHEALAELARSIELSPNFALGHYTLGFVEAQSGDPRTAIVASDTSRQLSPFDPLQFGMLGSRALAHLRLGELELANEFALRAIARPNAHVHILAIAACTLSLTERRDEARQLVARMRGQVPSYDVERFLRAFRLARDAEQLLRSGARAIGF